jgi:hypothetical protein
MSTIVDFFKSADIPFINIIIVKNAEGKKIPIGLPKDYSKLSRESIIELNNRPNILSYNEKYNNPKSSICGFLGLTDNIYCIDIDDENIKNINDYIKFLKENFKNNPNIINIISCLPYTPGNTKGIHIYIKIKYINEEYLGTNVFKNIKGDFFGPNKNNGNKFIWENIDKNIFNYNHEIPEINFEDIKDLFKSEISLNINDDNCDLINIDVSDINDSPEVIEIVKLISKSRFHDTNQWISMCTAFKKAGVSFKLFVSCSMSSSKYDFKACHDLYYKQCKNIVPNIKNISLLKYIARIDNEQKYIIKYGKNTNNASIIDNANIEELDKDLYNIIDINNRYLDLDKSDVIKNNVDLFFKSDIKTLSIKSPYGTGKSILLQKIISLYNPKRILFFSYRRSLTSDIYSKFIDYKFNDYRSNNVDCDRLIIQPESIRKLIDNTNTIKYYDLVIMDESESILSQFNSPTFKGDSRQCFNIFYNILSHQKTKIIALDGDLDYRSYEFYKQLGKSINIRNVFKNNKKIYKFIDDEEDFNKNIFSDIEKKIKISVASMSSSYIERLEYHINSNYKDIKILKITGLSDDNIKKDVLLNINDKIGNYDIFLYSPSVEAGVDINKIGFKQYGVVCPLSCSSRSFRQMLARTRNIINDEVIILNLGLKYNSINYIDFWKYEEIKEIINTYDRKYFEEDIYNDYEGTKVVVKNSAYNLIYGYNRLEKINNTSIIFMQNLINQLVNNNHVVIVPELKKVYTKEEKEIKKENKKDIDKKTSVNSKIIDAADITTDIYKSLIEKQKKDNATEEDKILINRYLYQNTLGIKELNEELLKKFDLQSIRRHLSLLDSSLLRNDDSINHIEQQTKIDIIKDSIKILGFDNLYNNEHYIQKWIIDSRKEEILTKSKLCTEWYEIKLLFNLDKSNECITDIRSYISTLNKILEPYYYRIDNKKRSCKDQNDKTCSMTVYYISIVNNIDEIIYNKHFNKNNGYLSQIDKIILDNLLYNIRYSEYKYQEYLDTAKILDERIERNYINKVRSLENKYERFLYKRLNQYVYDPNFNEDGSVIISTNSPLD